MADLQETLRQLRLKVDEVFVLKQQPDNLTNVKEFYKTDLLPHLLQIRKLNRSEKNALEAKYKKVKELSQVLYDTQQICDNLAFEADCLVTEVGKVSPLVRTSHNEQTAEMNGMEVDSAQQNGKYFDSDVVGRDDHITRLRLLDEEQAKRIALQEKLLQIKAEARDLESARRHNVAQLNQLKPPIKQLIEKVDTVKPNIK